MPAVLTRPEPRTRSIGVTPVILADLIDGQGNLSLVVGLQDATILDDQRTTVFADAVGRAARRGGTVTVDEAPPRPHRGDAAQPSEVLVLSDATGARSLLLA